MYYTLMHIHNNLFINTLMKSFNIFLKLSGHLLLHRIMQQKFSIGEVLLTSWSFSKFGYMVLDGYLIDTSQCLWCTSSRRWRIHQWKCNSNCQISQTDVLTIADQSRYSHLYWLQAVIAIWTCNQHRTILGLYALIIAIQCSIHLEEFTFLC